MPLLTDLVGLRSNSVQDVVEDRWTMNYAASVYDENEVYFDNLEQPPKVHPAYVSHLEWDAIGELHEKITGLDAFERKYGVHSYNSTTLHRVIRSGDVLSTTAEVVGVDRARSGGRMTIKLLTVADGNLIATSYTSTVFRGVEVVGDSNETLPPRFQNFSLEGDPTYSAILKIGVLAPYHFSECARDYGAMHTDMKAAAQAGLPGRIMHGTGTFAYALSWITNNIADGDPDRITHFEGRLGAVILCPSTITLNVWEYDEELRFEIKNHKEERALSNGLVRLSPKTA